MNNNTTEKKCFFCLVKESQIKNGDYWFSNNDDIYNPCEICGNYYYKNGKDQQLKQNAGMNLPIEKITKKVIENFNSTMKNPLANSFVNNTSNPYSIVTIVKENNSLLEENKRLSEQNKRLVSQLIHAFSKEHVDSSHKEIMELKEQNFDGCFDCNNTGKIIVSGEEFSCLRCDGLNYLKINDV